MKALNIVAALLGGLVSTSAIAAGDPEKGEQLFGRCVACHVIIDNDNNLLVDGGITGPNLYGVIGRIAGTENDYLNGGPRLPVGMFTDSMKDAGAAGLVWTEENLAAFVANPIGFVREYTGNDRSRVNMSVRFPQGGEDIAAYLATFTQ
ncbi:cytochrome C [Thalassobius sp. I31.1]|uniref:c-type cytochrome n=1 Tax=Thalassobius sp. I31.1 TaxID=2109912 RepID=UPI000D1BC233|nr:cytochrome C [Thalassobius sp. I31.1]